MKQCMALMILLTSTIASYAMDEDQENRIFSGCKRTCNKFVFFLTSKNEKWLVECVDRCMREEFFKNIAAKEFLRNIPAKNDEQKK